MLGLSCNNLKNINNVVNLKTEHAVWPFHLPGYIRKGKICPFIILKKYTSQDHCLKSCFRSTIFDLLNAFLHYI